MLALAPSALLISACNDLEPIDINDGSSTGTSSPTDSSGDVAASSSSGSADTTAGSASTDDASTGSTTSVADSSDSGGTGDDPDVDKDGFPASVDCDDDNPEIFPGAVEVCNGADDDCDAKTTEDGIVTIEGEGNFRTIGAAVAAASPGAEIQICAGTYVENLVIDQDVSLVSQAGAVATIIDGDGAGPTITVNSGEVTLFRLTLTGGDSAGFGGGLSVLGSDLVTVDQCVISANDSSDGAGIYATAGTNVALSQSTVATNDGEIGGGIAFYGDSLVIDDSTVENNIATEVGGGLFVSDGGSVLLTATLVTDNVAPDGAGIYIGEMGVTMEECTIERNNADGALLSGGASLVSTLSDWGTAIDDNTPTDVRVAGGGSWEYGAMASFECMPAVGCEEVF